MKRKVGLVIAVLFLISITGCTKIAFDYSKLEKQNIISEFYTDKARYAPNEEVKFTVKLSNPMENIEGNIIVIIKHLDNEVGRLNSDKIILESDVDKTIHLNWKAKEDDYIGYSAECWFVSKDKLVDMKATAIDVSSDWSKFPRYGYITNFPEMTDDEIQQIISRLNMYHINGLQFYDWQYKHQKPLAGTVDNPETKWKDIANRDVFKHTIDKYIEYAHDCNMMAMNYNLMFGAYSDFEEDGVKKEWGLYKDTKGINLDFHPLPISWATTKLCLMNPLNQEWQNYIFKEEKKVFEVFDFDGWHVDQLGNRGLRFDYDGKMVDLASSYPQFLNNAKKYLNKRIVFNTVEEYGQVFVAPNSDVDFLYTEVWNSNITYSSLKQIITRGINLSKGGKSVVLAAYMNYKKGDSKGEFNTPGVILTDAVIFASGGAHIELGDTGMLCKEYFPNDNLKMTDELKLRLIEYYDFSVAYQNLLRDNVEEVRRKVTIEGEKTSERGEGNSIWYFVKGKEDKEILHLINLLENDNLWRDNSGNKKKPPIKENLDLKYYINEDVKAVKLASPDLKEGILESVKYKEGRDSEGKYILITIPKLEYWDMIVIEK